MSTTTTKTRQHLDQNKQYVWEQIYSYSSFWPGRFWVYNARHRMPTVPAVYMCWLVLLSWATHRRQTIEQIQECNTCSQWIFQMPKPNKKKTRNAAKRGNKMKWRRKPIERTNFLHTKILGVLPFFSSPPCRLPFTLVSGSKGNNAPALRSVVCSTNTCFDSCCSSWCYSIFFFAPVFSSARSLSNAYRYSVFCVCVCWCVFIPVGGLAAVVVVVYLFFFAPSSARGEVKTLQTPMQ